MRGTKTVASPRGLDFLDHDTDEMAAMAQVAMRVRQLFPRCSPEVIDRALAIARQEFDGRPIRDFAPNLVERSATEALLASGLTTPASEDSTEASPESPTAGLVG
jgi:hypothetical protein